MKLLSSSSNVSLQICETIILKMNTLYLHNSMINYKHVLLIWLLTKVSCSAMIHRRRKEVLFGGGKVLIFARKARAKILGHTHLFEVQRSLVALEGATAVWS